MLELPAYRLEERRSSAGVYDFLDRETGRLVGVARLGSVAEKSPKRSVIPAPLGWIGAILGLKSWPPPAQRPRLIVRRADDDEPVFTLRQASGLLYDSRRVYDARGELIAHFRSHSKTTLRGGFAIIDLSGIADDGRDISDRPWRGRLVCSGDAYRFSLIGAPDAGRIARQVPPADHGQPDPPGRASPGHYHIDAAPELQGNTTSKILLLAAALAIAW
jgi:hypothetical protein